MKFTVNSISQSNVRLGKIIDFARLPDLILETPLLLLNTKGGSIPHISYEVLQKLSSESHGVQVPLPSSIQFNESLKDSEKCLSNFIGLEEYPTFFSVQDPARPTPGGYNTKHSVSAWSYTGRVTIDANGFMDIMEGLKPDAYQFLCDGDTNSKTQKKRCWKAVQNTTAFFETCYARHSKSEVLKSKGIFASIEGGYNVEARKKCALDLAGKPVHGFVFEGFHNNGGVAEEISFMTVEPILKEILPVLPKDKLLIIPGAWRPEVMLRLIEMGFDVCDSSLASVVTERFSALVFDYKEVNCDDCVGDTDATYVYEVSLKEDRFREDFTPIKPNCTCYTCKKFTRAYIHHLICVKELLAPTLLMIHNLHHMMEFFKAIRTAGAANKRIAMRQYL